MKQNNDFNELIGKKFGRLTILSIYNKNQSNQKRKIALCKCNCGKEKEIILDSIKKGVTTSCGCFSKEQRFKGTSKYVYNTEIFKTLTTESLYVLGLFYSDGNLHNKQNIFSITLQLNDKELLRIIAKILRNNETLYYSEKSNSATLFCTNKIMYQDLINLGLFPNKSTTIKINSRLESFSHFWRGMIDGDGSLFISNKRLYVSLCGTRSVCESFQKYCEGIGIKSISSVRSKPGYSFDFCEYQLCGKNAEIVCQELYNEAKDLKLKRKYENYENYIKSKGG